MFSVLHNVRAALGHTLPTDKLVLVPFPSVKRHLLLVPRLKTCGSIFLFVLYASTTWTMKSLLLSLTLCFSTFHILILFYSLISVLNSLTLIFFFFFLWFVHHHRRIMLYFILAVFCSTSSIEKHFRVFFITKRHAHSSPVFS